MEPNLLVNPTGEAFNFGWQITDDSGDVIARSASDKAYATEGDAVRAGIPVKLQWLKDNGYRQ